MAAFAISSSKLIVMLSIELIADLEFSIKSVESQLSLSIVKKLARDQDVSACCGLTCVSQIFNFTNCAVRMSERRYDDDKNCNRINERNTGSSKWCCSSHVQKSDLRKTFYG